MNIDFYIEGETNVFSWWNARNIPRKGDYVRDGSGAEVGRKLEVIEITWNSDNFIEILTRQT